MNKLTKSDPEVEVLCTMNCCHMKANGTENGHILNSGKEKKNQKV